MISQHATGRGVTFDKITCTQEALKRWFTRHNLANLWWREMQVLSCAPREQLLKNYPYVQPTNLYFRRSSRHKRIIGAFNDTNYAVKPRITLKSKFFVENIFTNRISEEKLVRTFFKALSSSGICLINCRIYDGQFGSMRPGKSCKFIGHIHLHSILNKLRALLKYHYPNISILIQPTAMICRLQDQSVIVDRACMTFKPCSLPAYQNLWKFLQKSLKFPKSFLCPSSQNPHTHLTQ